MSSNNKYFVLDCYCEPPMASLGKRPRLPGGTWFKGRRLAVNVPSPLVFTLDLHRTGNMQAFFDGGIPLMSNELVAAIKKAGVDNIETYNVVIKNEETGKEYQNYKAINIIGLISCADMDNSVLMGTSDSAMIDIDFDSLVIDESKTNGLLIFRLAEAVSAIVVHEKVKEAIVNAQIPGMIFLGPGEWAG